MVSFSLSFFFHVRSGVAVFCLFDEYRVKGHFMTWEKQDNVEWLSFCYSALLSFMSKNIISSDLIWRWINYLIIKRAGQGNEIIKLPKPNTSTYGLKSWWSSGNSIFINLFINSKSQWSKNQLLKLFILERGVKWRCGNTTYVYFTIAYLPFKRSSLNCKTIKYLININQSEINLLSLQATS